MSLDTLRRTSRSSDALSSCLVSLASMQDCGGGSSGATEVSGRGDCSENGWVQSSGKATLSWWFLAGVVLALESSVESSPLVLMKSAVGQAITPIFSSETL